MFVIFQKRRRLKKRKREYYILRLENKRRLKILERQSNYIKEIKGINIQRRK